AIDPIRGSSVVRWAGSSGMPRRIAPPPSGSASAPSVGPETGSTSRMTARWNRITSSSDAAPSFRSAVTSMAGAASGGCGSGSTVSLPRSMPEGGGKVRRVVSAIAEVARVESASRDAASIRPGKELEQPRRTTAARRGPASARTPRRHRVLPEPGNREIPDQCEDHEVGREVLDGGKNPERDRDREGAVRDSLRDVGQAVVEKRRHEAAREQDGNARTGGTRRFGRIQEPRPRQAA